MEVIQKPSFQDTAHVLQRVQGIQQQRKDLEDEFVHMVLRQRRSDKTRLKVKNFSAFSSVRAPMKPEVRLPGELLLKYGSNTSMGGQ
jgi:hypothetical protein